MRRSQDPDSIRPSVLLLAVALLLGVGLALFGAARWASTPRGERSAWASFGLLGDGQSGPPEGEQEAQRGRGGIGGRLRDPETARTGSWDVQSVDEDWLDPNEGDDPQLFAMRRSLDAYASEGSSLSFMPSRRRATLINLEGERALAEGSECTVRVLPVLTGGFNCLVQVICGGELLYPEPNQRAGYVACEIEDGVAVRAADSMHTHRDGDPAVTFDMREGVVVVSDSGPGISPFTARISLGSSHASLSPAGLSPADRSNIGG